MAANSSERVEAASAERLRGLAQRCRDLSEMTAVPDVTRELERIADALDREAALMHVD